MLITILALILEGILSNIILRPNNEAEFETVSLIFLIINTVLLFISINSSVSSKTYAFSPEERNLRGKLLDEEEFIKTLIFLSLIVRLVILIWDVYARDIFILPNSEGDAEWYHKIGISFAYGSRAGQVNFNYYPFYVGLLYRAIGVQKITVQFINIYLAICSVVMIYKILRRFDINPSICKMVMGIVCFLPNLMMITTFFLQESVIAFCIVSSLYFFTKWWFGDGNLNIVWSVLMSMAGSMLHMGSLTIGIGVLVMLVLVGNKDRRLNTSPQRIILMIFAGVIVLVALVTFGGDLLGKLGGDVSVENILGESEKRVEGGAVYSIGITGLPPAVDLVVNTPIRMFYFVFSPLPWMWRGLGDILGFFGSTIFYFYTSYFVFKAIKTKPVKTLPDDNLSGFLFTLLVIILIAAIMFGWGVSNAGSVLRHREKFTYLFVVLLAVSKEILLRVGKKNES